MHRAGKVLDLQSQGGDGAQQSQGLELRQRQQVLHSMSWASSLLLHSFLRRKGFSGIQKEE